MPAVSSHCDNRRGYAHHHPHAHPAALAIGARGVVLLMKNTPGRLRRTLKPAGGFCLAKRSHNHAPTSTPHTALCFGFAMAAPCPCALCR